MNIEMNNKQIKSISFPDGGIVKTEGQTTLALSATYHGDRDEFWVVQYNDMKEIARQSSKPRNPCWGIQSNG
jgi:hypothetical protein